MIFFFYFTHRTLHLLDFCWFYFAPFFSGHPPSPSVLDRVRRAGVYEQKPPTEMGNNNSVSITVE